MPNVIINNTNLTNIANAIRTKNKSETTYKPSEMAAAVLAINTDPSGDATATENDILLNKTAYARGQKLTGTIPTKTEQDITSSAGIVTVPAGYYAVEAHAQGDPSGECTATDNDILSGKTAYASNQLRTGTILTKTGGDVTHNANEVNIPNGYYASDVVHSIPESTLSPSAISGQAYLESEKDYVWKSTVEIPAGYYQQQTVERTFSEIFPAPETEGTAAELRLGYELFNHEGKKITGSMAEKTTATYTPTTSDITINANLYLLGDQIISGDTNLIASNIALGKTIFGVEGSFTSDADATSSDILLNKTAYVSGSKVDGAMTNNGAVSNTITTQNGTYTIPAGYHNGSGVIKATLPVYTGLG